MMEQLTLRLSEKEESLEQAQEEHKQLQNQITSVEQELSSTQDEVNKRSSYELATVISGVHGNGS